MVTRIEPVPVAQMTEEQLELAGGAGNSRAELNFVKVMVQHPVLYRTWAPFAEQLMVHSGLPGRHREILVIHTLAMGGERWEAAHHVYIGRGIGLSDEEMESAKGDGKALRPLEQLLVKAADELLSSHRLSDETWTKLSSEYSTQQMMELVFLVANYSLIAMATNSFGVEPEGDVEGAWKPFE